MDVMTTNVMQENLKYLGPFISDHHQKNIKNKQMIYKFNMGLSKYEV